MFNNMLSKNRIVSVVIPTHNRADLLLRAVKSVQEQTYKDIEIIVVSDGSTDNTKSIVEELALVDRRIKFINQQISVGANAARNEGIKNSIGEYIAFLDDDDEWINDKLSCQLAVMESSSKIGLVYTWKRVIYVNENMEYISKSNECGNLTKRILLGNCIGTTSSVMVKKSLLKKVGGFDVNLPASQDYDLWIRCCQECDIGVVKAVKINYYNYTSNGNSQISANTEKYIFANKYIDEKYMEFFKTLNKKEMRDKKRGVRLFILRKIMRNKDRDVAKRILKESFDDGVDFKICIYYLLTYVPYRCLLFLKKKML